MYTIKLKDSRQFNAVVFALGKAIMWSRFHACPYPGGPRSINVKPIRLREAKPYCGQHPGSCVVGPRRRAKWLEWGDWVEFHGLVNDVLDRLGVNANVWTNPPEPLDYGRRMWVRRGLRRRYHYDWIERADSFRPVRIWNHGTPDQFIKEQ